MIENPSHNGLIDMYYNQQSCYAFSDLPEKNREKKNKYKNTFNDIHNSTTKKYELRNDVRKVCHSPAHNGT